MPPLTVEELMEFEPAIQAVAKHMKLQRESARVSEDELAQMIRINVWLYGKSFSEKYHPGYTRMKAMENWLMSIGKNSLLKEVRRRKPTELLPRDAKHVETPAKKIEQKEAELNYAKTFLVMLQLLGARMKKLSHEHQEVARRLGEGQTAIQIYQEYLAARARTKASTYSHEKVRGSREVKKVLRNLFEGPRPRRKR